MSRTRTPRRILPKCQSPLDTPATEFYFLFCWPGKQFLCILIEPQNLFAFYISKLKHLIEYGGRGTVRRSGSETGM